MTGCQSEPTRNRKYRNRDAEGRRSPGSWGRIFLVTSFMRVKEVTPRRIGDQVNPRRKGKY